MEKGYLIMMLHAHLPYVHHPDSRAFLEERWLFEAMTETYIPLLGVLEGLRRDRVHCRITMSLTPTLLEMLASPLLQLRYAEHLDRLIDLAEREAERIKGEPAVRKLAEMYRARFVEARNRFEGEYGGNLINGFRSMQEAGCLELITSSATHAFLPYIRSEQSLRAQLELGIETHIRHLGARPKGIWLPECAYRPGLDALLKQYGLFYFFVDTHAAEQAEPKPEHGAYAPVMTPAGVAAFARDAETSKQVWSSLVGYPGDADYREYYRDIGYDLDYDRIRPYLHESGVRHNTGIKYFRITGSEPKLWYDPDRAALKAAEHAGHFMFHREKQIEYRSARMNRKPVVVASYDAELFGHWWYEGPQWIDMLCRKLHAEQQTVKLATPLDYLREYDRHPQCELSMTSWGRGGYGDVWLGESNAWMYERLHRMEERMIHLAERFRDAGNPLTCRALNQCVRELLLAQSSDWAFIMDQQTMVDYALRRFYAHEERFNRLYHNIIGETIDESWLASVEREDAAFPTADFRLFRASRGEQANSSPNTSGTTAERERSPLRKVLMLSWEFPPMTVGGLSRHVFELACKLVSHAEVHVVTCGVDGFPEYEINRGIHVHRVKTDQSESLDFMEWVFQLNLAMLRYCRNLMRNHVTFDVLHAHDWLVGVAAKALKHESGLPLIATIHATEHGRNQGISTELQHRIHSLEWELAYEAKRVICCSSYMVREVEELFQLPAGKLVMIPNGVESKAEGDGVRAAETALRYKLPGEKMVLFVGRLVREKGVHVLLESITDVLEACPEAKFVIAGKGPAEGELRAMTERLGVAHKVAFCGFVEEAVRDDLFRSASVCVFPSLYEPFGIVALEAMAFGTPLIVSGTGGLQEIVDYGVDGYTVLPGDARSLSSHIVKVLLDPHQSADLALRALRKATEHYNWDTIAVQTAEVYETVSETSTERTETEIGRDSELAFIS